MAKFLDSTGLTTLWAKIKTLFSRSDSYTTPTTDTKGHWTVTIPGVTKLYDGLKIHIRLGTIHYINGELYNTLNVNGLGAKLVWYRYNKVFTDEPAKNDEFTLTYRTDAGSYKVTRTTGELTYGTTYTDGWVCESYAGSASYATNAGSASRLASFSTRSYCPVYFSYGQPHEVAGQEYFSYTNTNGYCFPMFNYTEVQKSAVGSYTFTFPPIVTFELHFSYWYYGTTSIPVQTILKGTVCLTDTSPSIHWEIVSHNVDSILTTHLKDIVWDKDNKQMVLRLQGNIAGDGKYIAAMYCANYGSPRITINTCSSSSAIAESSLSSNLVTFDIPTASTEDRIKALETKLTTYNG